MEIFIILMLQMTSGIFAMSEVAMIAARRPRLAQLAERGRRGAATALSISADPNRFLATVQIFITMIGILGGAFGGATIAGSIADLLQSTPLAPYGTAIGLTIVVLFTTYSSLIVAELVPKRLALRSPETIAARIALPMQFLSIITAPVVHFLGWSTDLVLRLLGARHAEEVPVTEEEIKAMIKLGVEAGVFKQTEHDMVRGVFRLGDRRISALMTPRSDIVWLNTEDDEETNRAKIRESHFSRFPVARGNLDHVLGMVQAKDLLEKLLAGQPFDLHAVLMEPIYVPMSMAATRVLETFRDTNTYMAFVLDEYGGLIGLVTAQDILESIVGEEEAEEPTQRADGSWLFDGLIAIDDLVEHLGIELPPGAHEQYETLSGFIMTKRGNIPHTGDIVDWDGYRFEVVDMDGRRVDKVLVAAIEPADAPDPSQTNGAGPAETPAPPVP
ncbi:MAG: hemolysin family protein [Aggregatilineales bacterium]